MAKSTGETSTPVIIALVFFVLCTLILGYTTFEFNNQMNAARGEAKKAADEKSTAEKTAIKAKNEAIMYKSLIGIATAEERKDLEGASKPELEDSFKKMMASVQSQANAALLQEQSRNPGARGLTGIAPLARWDWPADGNFAPTPQTSLLNGAISNFAARTLSEISVANERKALADNSAKLGKAIQDVEALAADYKKKLGDLPADIAKGIAQVKADMDAYKKMYEDDAKQRREETQTFENKAAKAELDKLRQSQQIQSLQNSYAKMEEITNALVDPFQFDRPQGKIIRRYSDNLVDIDIGSASNVRRGLTFAVFPSDTPTRGMQSRMRPVKDERGQTLMRPVPKGKIEVIDVLGPNLSQCRVTDEESAVRDRILAGDLLYNAIWRKGSADHIVLYGIFDLDGDGKDDIKTLINDLTRVGVVVDAFFDFSTMKWEGDFTSQTTFAVEGFSPEVKATDGNVAAKSNILSEITKARQAAKDRGVRILRPRDFFPRIGYNARMDIDPDAINQAATAYIRQFAPSDTSDPNAPAAAPMRN